MEIRIFMASTFHLNDLLECYISLVLLEALFANFIYRKERNSNKRHAGHTLK